MRIAIVGALAILGMSLTSATVWSLSSPDPESTSGSRRAQVPSGSTPGAAPSVLGLFTNPQAEPPSRPKVDKSTFVTGKTLMIEGRLGHGRMLADARGETFLFIDVRNDPGSTIRSGSSDIPRRSTFAQPVNLAIAIDHSGSMKGQRERNATAAAAGMVGRLRDGDTVSIVTYATEARMLVATTTIDTRSRQRILEQLRDGSASRPSGNTCISCGLDLALRSLENRRAGVDRMLLLSDGEANRGVRDEPGIRALARKARNRGVSISSIGVDIDYNERLMSALAREANGHHYFSETGSNLEQIFDQEFETLVSSVAKNGELVVELSPGVRVAEVFDRSYRQVGRRLTVPLGTFSAGEDKTLLIRLDVPPSPSGERPIANITLRYDDLYTERPGECFGVLATTMIDTPAEVAPLDAIVLSRLTRSETASTLQESNRLFALGRVGEAKALVDGHLLKVDKRKKSAAKSMRSPGFEDPFSRDLDHDFDAQEGALSGAAGSFEEAANTDAPTASAPAQAQVRRNATAADAFSL